MAENRVGNRTDKWFAEGGGERPYGLLSVDGSPRYRAEAVIAASLSGRVRAANKVVPQEIDLSLYKFLYGGSFFCTPPKGKGA